MATTLITGGTVVNATGRGAADVLIDGEKIVALLTPGSTLLGTDLSAGVDRVIDATGKYVIPGGIDAHTHMEMPFGGTFASDTFETGTTAAAWGGTTTIVDFVVQTPGETRSRTVCRLAREGRGQLRGRLRVPPDHGGRARLLAARRWTSSSNEGVTSFKLFMAYPGVFYSDDGQILGPCRRPPTTAR